MTYVVLIEQGPESYGASVPDLPGCVAVGETLDEVRAAVREAITFHLEGLIEEGIPIPLPAILADSVDVPCPKS